MSTGLLEPPVKSETESPATSTEATSARPEAAATKSPVGYELLDRTEHSPVVAPAMRRRRRRLIVDRRAALRMSLMSTTFVLVPLIGFNLLGLLCNRLTMDAVIRTTPHLAAEAAAQNRMWSITVLIVSCVFLVGVLCVTLLETRRTAGPAFRIARALEALRDGQLSEHVRLRDGDHLGELGNLFNDVAGSLWEREDSEIKELERVAAELESGHPGAATALIELADRKRALIS